MRVKNRLFHIWYFSLIYLFLLLFCPSAAGKVRYFKLAAVGDIRIEGKGYRIIEDNRAANPAPLPNEKFSEYRKRTGPVSRLEFAHRKHAAEDAFLLSPSRGGITEILQIVFSHGDNPGCYQDSKTEGSSKSR